MKKKLIQLIFYAFDNQYLTVRAVRFAEFSVFLNLAIALGKISIGIYSLSLFICVNGFYNIGIAFAKRVMVRSHGEAQQRKHYRLVGRIIFATSLIYMIYCGNLAIRGSANITYDTIASITIATFTFTEIALAVNGIVQARKLNNLTLAAAMRINLVTALVSIVLTQAALLGMSAVENAARYCGWVGLIFCAVSAMIGLFMTFDKSKRLDNKLPYENLK